jgi:hypothetical protein
LGRIYRRYFAGAAQQKLLFSSAAYLVTFAAARAFAHAIKNKLGPFRNISAGGTHLHHSFWGIFSLLSIGYVWALGIGGEPERQRTTRVMALVYGAGAALTLDEYALWLKLQDDYKIRDDDY